MNTGIHILIAEDEANIALALKTIVSKAVPGASITVVNNGSEALEAFNKSSFQLVISDWNMPVMTGIELLSELRSKKVTMNIPFLMLTARGDKESVVSAVQGGVTEYISKPFEKQNIIEKVQALLGSSPVTIDEEEKISIESLSKKLRNGNIDFPVFPAVGMKAVELISSADVTIEKLSNLIQQDAALTSKLLAIANSPYYGGSRKFDSIDDAVVRIGLQETNNIILTISNKALYINFPGAIGEQLEDLWEHSFATGACARVIAKELKLMYPDRMFAIGQLHDVGKLALLTVLNALSKNRDISPDDVNELLENLHVEFGEYLATSWNMPTEFIDAITNHHNLEGMKDFHVTTRVVAMANLLVRQLGESLVPDDGSNLSKTELAGLLQLTDKMIESILVKTSEHIEALRNNF